MSSCSECSTLREENARLRSELEAYRHRERLASGTRRGLGHLFVRVYMGRDLRAALSQMITEGRESGNVSSDSIAWVAASLAHRILRTGALTIVMALFGGILGSTLLVWQNIEIRNQSAEQRRATDAAVELEARRMSEATFETIPLILSASYETDFDDDSRTRTYTLSPLFREIARKIEQPTDEARYRSSWDSETGFSPTPADVTIQFMDRVSACFPTLARELLAR